MRVACLWFAHETPLERLAELCLRLSPQIGLRKNRALFIEYGKCHLLYSEKTFTQRLQVLLRRLDLHASLGLGENLIEALLRAKYQTHFRAELPLSALYDVADPLGQDMILQKYVEKMIFSFTDLGVRHLQSFAQLPARDLASRFGSAGLFCHQRARGESLPPWPLWKPAERIREKTEFPGEFQGELDPLLFYLKSQLDAIFQRLFSRGKKMQKMKIILRCENLSQVSQRQRVFIFDFLFPQSQSKGVLPIVRERLARELEANPFQAPLEFLETQVLETAPSSVGQKNFFHQREETEEKRNALLERLIETHGTGNIFFAELTPDRRPERSWKKSSRPQATGLFYQQVPERPTHLLKPEKVDLDQGTLFLRGKRYAILSFSAETEKISGAWQENPLTGLQMGFAREYFSVKLEDGRRLFLFKTENDEFYLHGYNG